MNIMTIMIVNIGTLKNVMHVTLILVLQMKNIRGVHGKVQTYRKVIKQVTVQHRKKENVQYVARKIMMLNIMMWLVQIAKILQNVKIANMLYLYQVLYQMLT